MSHKATLAGQGIAGELGAVHQLLQHERPFAADVHGAQECVQAGWLARHDQHVCPDGWVVQYALEDEPAGIVKIFQCLS